jgi:hypothetical protein
LRAGCHYIDVTAEQASAQATFADFDAAARAADRVVIPAAGFYGGLADLLATALASAGEIDEITVAIALDRWWPTVGTRKTGERNTAPRVVVKDGRLAPLTPSEAPDWDFLPPLGRQPMVDLPFSEVITMAHHLKIGTLRSLFNRSALNDIRDPTTPPPTAVDDSGRSAQRFELAVRLKQNGVARPAGARGQDIYAVTAPIVIETALRLLALGTGAVAHYRWPRRSTPLSCWVHCTAGRSACMETPCKAEARAHFAGHVKLLVRHLLTEEMDKCSSHQ